MPHAQRALQPLHSEQTIPWHLGCMVYASLEKAVRQLPASQVPDQVPWQLVQVVRARDSQHRWLHTASAACATTLARARRPASTLGCWVR